MVFPVYYFERADPEEDKAGLYSHKRIAAVATKEAGQVYASLIYPENRWINCVHNIDSVMDQ